MRDIQRGQVHQLERPKPESGLIAQDAVNRGEIGNALADDAQRFGAVAPPGMVDDEAWRVLRQHGRMPHLAGILAK